MVDLQFVRQAVMQADLNALRAALYQATGDGELERMRLTTTSLRAGAQATVSVAPEHRETLRAKATAYLLEEAPRHVLRAPDDAELRRLMEFVHGERLSDDHFMVYRDTLAFADFPRLAQWPGVEPDLPGGLKVAVIGAGFSGIAMGVQLGLLGIPYFILERRSEIGGVRSVNTYPDARVDTASAAYEYSFTKGHAWTEFFARQQEVRAYLEQVAREHDVFRHIRFGHDVTSAAFDELRSGWVLDISVDGGSALREFATFVVSAAGLFANPRKLDVEGAERFEGELVHSTEWTDRVSVSGRSVAIIGNGSTGVQLLSPIAKEASRVFVFQRTPQWISPRERYGEKITAAHRWLFDSMPYYWNWYRYAFVIPFLDGLELLVPDAEWQRRGGLFSERNDAFRLGLIDYVTGILGQRRPELLRRLIPGHPPMARRLVVDNDWYRTLLQDHVELVSEPITRMTRSGILTADGTERPVDVIVAAVGFDPHRYLWPTVYRGPGRVTLEEVWGDGRPRAYLGMMVPSFPNLFVLYGPNSQPISGGLMLPSWIEIWTAWIAQVVIGTIERDCTRVEVRQEAFDQFYRRLDREAAKLVYHVDQVSRPRNYYVDGGGRLVVQAPWDAPEYFRQLQHPDFGDLLVGTSPAAAQVGGHNLLCRTPHVCHCVHLDSLDAMSAYMEPENSS